MRAEQAPVNVCLSRVVEISRIRPDSSDLYLVVEYSSNVPMIAISLPMITSRQQIPHCMPVLQIRDRSLVEPGGRTVKSRESGGPERSPPQHEPTVRTR